MQHENVHVTSALLPPFAIGRASSVAFHLNGEDLTTQVSSQLGSRQNPKAQLQSCSRSRRGYPPSRNPELFLRFAQEKPAAPGPHR